MNVVDHIASHGVVIILIPDVGKAVQMTLFLHLRE